MNPFRHTDRSGKHRTGTRTSEDDHFKKSKSSKINLFCGSISLRWKFVVNSCVLCNCASDSVLIGSSEIFKSFSVLIEDECWHGLNSFFTSNLLCLIHINLENNVIICLKIGYMIIYGSHFQKDDFSLKFFWHFFKNWCDHSAWWTPSSKKIHAYEHILK